MDSRKNRYNWSYCIVCCLKFICCCIEKEATSGGKTATYSCVRQKKSSKSRLLKILYEVNQVLAQV